MYLAAELLAMLDLLSMACFMLFFSLLPCTANIVLAEWRTTIVILAIFNLTMYYNPI